MILSIRHLTKFHYSAPISESVMEVRMHPRSEGAQRCLSFHLSLSPPARIRQYQDHLGNIVHHFDIPGHHTELNLLTHSYVETSAPPALPPALPAAAWAELDRLVAEEDHWDMLVPSHFATPTPRLRALAAELGAVRRDDPLTLLRELSAGLHQAFTYAPRSTRVDSPIDEALAARRGVCQDYAHVLIALGRELGIPSRYVSGYLFHRVGDTSMEMSDATHAWAEMLLPGLGWVGFDSANDLIAAERHVRTAIGRDYADVPPTRGVYKGGASCESELQVAVRVAPATGALPQEPAPPVAGTGPLPALQAGQQQ